MKATVLVLALTALATAALAGCGTATGAAAKGGQLSVVAAFYPLEFAAQQVGGAHVQVSELTKPGAEPHDLELTPKDVASLSKADVVLYERSFQPAVDDAVKQVGGDKAFDVAPAAHLDLNAAQETRGGTAASGQARGGQDPHFWLAPRKYAAVVAAIAADFGQRDPAHRADYRANARKLSSALDSLDASYAAGLKTCANRELVTNHAAFGYLAQAYGLRQESINGIDPEGEPDPAQLARLSDRVRADHVHTIYSETLVSPKVAETVARETGASVAVLDPIEGLTAASAGRDYLQVMRSNLATLEKGQGCS